jgi:hypothetical protein
MLSSWFNTIFTEVAGLEVPVSILTTTVKIPDIQTGAIVLPTSFLATVALVPKIQTGVVRPHCTITSIIAKIPDIKSSTVLPPASLLKFTSLVPTIIGFVDPNPPLERVNYRGTKRLFLVQIEMGSETLYLSSKTYNYVNNYGEQLYLPYLKEVTDISESPGYMDVSSLNSSITLSFFNKTYSDNGDSLLEYFLSNSVELKEIKVYELRMNSWDEEFVNPEPGLLLFHGVVNQLTDISESTFQLSCDSLIYSLNNKFKAETLTKEEYPGIDSDFIGKIPNIVYGKVSKVPCQAIDAGGVSVLVDDINFTVTSITLSDASSFPNSGKIGIDDEFIWYTGKIGNLLTGCTRGDYSTEAVNHIRGVHVWEEKSQFVFLAANHPVKSLGIVHIDDCKTTAGIVKYTGQTGDELPAYPGKAVITADYKQIFKQKVDLGIADSISIAASASNFEKKYGTSAYSNTWIDGDDRTFYDLSGTYRSVNFSGSRTASETHIHLSLNINPYPNNVSLSVMLGSTVQSRTYSSNTTKVRFVFSGNHSENSTVQIKYTGSGGPIHCYQVWKEVRVTNNPTRSGSVALSGNSSIDTKIGKDFTVDVEGYQDNSSGTITGTPNTLLEYPSDILEHIWTVIFGRDSSEIGYSFSESKTTYITNNFKFSILLNYMYDGSIQDLFMNFALQCKSRIHFYRGCLELVYQESAPPIDTNYLAITKDNRCDSPIFERTDIGSIINFVKGFYNTDYTKNNYSDSITMEDVDSQNKYGKIEQKFDFEAITSQAHATAIVNWILYEKKDTRWSVDVRTMSPALGLGFEDLFYIQDSNIVDDIAFHISDISYNDTTVALHGFEWSDNVPTKYAIGIEIEGPISVDDNTITDYSCRIYYNDGYSAVIEPTWQENTMHASISNAGEFSTSMVDNDELCTIEADYTESGSNFNDSHAVKISRYSGSTGKLFCCSAGSNKVYYTSDGINWNPGNTTINNPNCLCAYNGSLFCTSIDDDKVYYTSDGINWTAGNTIIPEALHLCVYDGKLYCSSNNSDYVYYTSDGINWTPGNTFSGRGDLYVFNGKLYCSSINADKVYYTGDGINWTAGNTLMANPRSLCVFGNKLYASSINDKVKYTSDGINWTSGDTFIPNTWDLFVFNNKLYCPVASVNTVYYTINGHNWIAGNTGEVSNPKYLSEYDGKLFCTGNTRVYYTSDGINWTHGNTVINNPKGMCFYNMPT